MAAAVPTVGNIGSDIEMAAGDFFQWVTQSVNAVTGFVVQEANGLYHFLATVGNLVYDVLLDCIGALAMMWVAHLILKLRSPEKLARAA